MRRLSHSQGFTLIELLIAVLIIGILAAIALPALNKQRERAKDSAAQQGLEAGLRAAKAVYADGESFPASGLGTLLGRAERSQTFADGTAFPAAGTINVDRPSANRVILRTTSRSGNQHMLALEEPDSRVTRYGPTPDSASGALPTYTNLLVNPSAEVNSSNWGSYVGNGTISSTATSTADSYVGSRSMESSATGLSNTVYYLNAGGANSVQQLAPVSPDTTYTLAIAAKLVSCSGCSAGPQTVRITAREYDSALTQLGDRQIATFTAQPGEWKRLRTEYSWSAASGVTGVQISAVWFGMTGNVTVRADGAMLVAGRTQGYLDGTTPGAVWNGAAHLSTSTGPAGAGSW